MKHLLKRIPLLGPLTARALRLWRKGDYFTHSADYWKSRYRHGGTSGSGSYGRLATFKAEILNAIVALNGVKSVIEFGCGDGNQLQLARYPSYIGFDVSEVAVDHCRRLFEGDQTKRFALVEDYTDEVADLTLSLDVIYHLVEDDVFDAYMKRLFDSSLRYVVIYSSNREDAMAVKSHVRHRRFTAWVERHRQGWVLSSHIPNRFPNTASAENAEHESFADFYVFALRSSPSPLVPEVAH